MRFPAVPGQPVPIVACLVGTLSSPYLVLDGEHKIGTPHNEIDAVRMGLSGALPHYWAFSLDADRVALDRVLDATSPALSVVEEPGEDGQGGGANRGCRAWVEQPRDEARVGILMRRPAEHVEEVRYRQPKKRTKYRDLLRCECRPHTCKQQSLQAV